MFIDKPPLHDLLKSLFRAISSNLSDILRFFFLDSYNRLNPGKNVLIPNQLQQIRLKILTR